MHASPPLLPQPLRDDLHLRHDRLRAALEPLGADALILALNTNLIYASGTVMNGWFYLPAEGAPVYFYRRPSNFAAWLPEFETVAVRRPEEIAAHLAAAGRPLPRRLALAGDELPAAEWLRLGTCFPEAELVNGTSAVRGVRAVKTAYEIECMRAGCRQHASVVATFPSFYRRGMTDLDFSIALEHAMRRNGSLGIFRTYGGRMEIFMGSVLAGDNAAAPSVYDFALGGAGMHPTIPIGANRTPLREGQTVMVDLAGNFNGYHSDCSRTYAIGAVPERVREAHNVSIAISEALAREGRSGTPCEALYTLALQLADEAGLAKHFMGYHQQAKFVGHGVGLEINELPVLAARIKGNLESGMILALEPKFVFPGVGPVGVENTYLVTDTGLEKLTLCDEALVTLG
ncbi:MAG: M24 family metallopeptidase [Kiritimatiellia bacterium]|jgi:Xaa-Pro aminopeptidase